MSTTVNANGQSNTVGNSGVHEGYSGSLGTTAHDYCATKTELTPDTAATAGAGNILTVTVAPGTTCGSSLPNGTKTVIMNNANSDAISPFGKSGTSWSFRNGTGCWFTPSPAGLITLGTMNVTSGAGTGTYTLPNTLNRVDTANVASSLCVGLGGSGSANGGMIIPIVINDIQV